MINKIYLFILGGSSHNIPEIIKEAEDEFSSTIIDDLNSKMYLEASLMTCIGAASILTGSVNKGNTSLDRSVHLWRELELKAELARSYWYLAIHTENIKEAITLLEEALEVWKDLGNKYRYARTLCLIGANYQTIGNFNSAITYNRRALSISENLGYQVGIVNAKECLGKISLARGESREAVQHFEETLALVHDMENPTFELYTRRPLGRAFFQRGETRLAFECFEQSLALTKKIGLGLHWQIRPIFYLITTALALESRSQATAYNKQLQQLNEIIQTANSSAYSRLSEALILKTSHRLRDQMESQRLLEEILQDDKQVPWEVRILTLKNLCSLLLLEVEINNDPKVLFEVITKIDKIKEIAEDQHLFPVKIEALIFQAKLALVQGKLEEAEQLLLKAEEMAIDKELGHMMLLVKDERNRLHSDLKKWEDLTNSNAPVRVRFEKAELMNYMKLALDVRDRSDADRSPPHIGEESSDL